MAQVPAASQVSADRSGKLDRLIYFEVRGLFGEFTHRIPIKTDLRITAIIAPNGSGNAESPA
jgi:hypothetical protein